MSRITRPGAKGVTANDILVLLRRKYGGVGIAGSNWLGIEELRCGAGYSGGRRAGVERRIDFFAIHQHPSRNNHERYAFEIKVSRGDFLKEMQEPRKRKMGLMYSNEFYYVAPRNLLAESEIPPECGLMEYDYGPDGTPRLMTKRKAPWRDTEPPTWTLFVSAIRKERKQTDD